MAIGRQTLTILQSCTLRADTICCFGKLATNFFVQNCMLPCRAVTFHNFTDANILIKKLLTMLSSSDEGQSGHCSCRVARWNAYRLTLRFPVPRAAVSLGGWSACLLGLSSGI